MSNNEAAVAALIHTVIDRLLPKIEKAMASSTPSDFSSILRNEMLPQILLLLSHGMGGTPGHEFKTPKLSSETMHRLASFSTAMMNEIAHRASASATPTMFAPPANPSSSFVTRLTPAFSSVSPMLLAYEAEEYTVILPPPPAMPARLSITVTNPSSASSSLPQSVSLRSNHFGWSGAGIQGGLIRLCGGRTLRVELAHATATEVPAATPSSSSAPPQAPASSTPAPPSPRSANPPSSAPAGAPASASGPIVSVVVPSPAPAGGSPAPAATVTPQETAAALSPLAPSMTTAPLLPLNASAVVLLHTVSSHEITNELSRLVSLIASHLIVFLAYLSRVSLSDHVSL